MAGMKYLNGHVIDRIEPDELSQLRAQLARRDEEVKALAKENRSLRGVIDAVRREAQATQRYADRSSFQQGANRAAKNILYTMDKSMRLLAFGEGRDGV